MSLNAATIEFLLSKGLSGADLLEVARLSEARSSGAERQARYRQRKAEERNESDVTRYVTPSPNEIDILTPTRESKTEPKGSSKSRIGEEKREAISSCLRVAFPPPLGVTDEQWAAFRSQRKKKLNTRSYTLLVNKLARLAEDGWPPGEMIDLAIERGWESVFAPRNFGNERRNTPSPLDQLVAASFGLGAGTG